MCGPAARFAVPYIFCGGRSRLENIDRCTALGSLLPPPAALPSLTQRATLVGLITRRAQHRFCRADKKRQPAERLTVFFGCGGRTRTYALLRCPANVLGDGAPASLADRCHSLASLGSATGGGQLAPLREPGGRSRLASQAKKRKKPSPLG